MNGAFASKLLPKWRENERSFLGGLVVGMLR